MIVFFLIPRLGSGTSAAWAYERPKPNEPSWDGNHFDNDANGLKSPLYPLLYTSSGLASHSQPAARAYEYSGRYTTLTASAEGFDQGDEPVTFVGKRQRKLAGVASKKLTAGTVISSNGLLQTGLCYYKDEHPFSRIFLGLKSRQVIGIPYPQQGEVD
ncbi:uncharacterized protein DSM5745_00788 [Aspergillus mulundensis]|uniref:Uncharacterized protein n=1 Tax=Aspergillus mulundensis TaxID=1810919 RepID=A0A3D8T4I5_9EURO|nr:hypothetical protein DSM5745_00788 [Aspergillus mulundensis]RDW93466.1 hypothetical protein DSM5745_00788 [Aspergillus mulundensis]